MEVKGKLTVILPNFFFLVP